MKLTIDVSRDGWTDGLQLSISKRDEAGLGDGYRLAGPKFNGSSENVLTTTLDERDAAEIRRYLDAEFPQACACIALARNGATMAELFDRGHPASHFRCEPVCPCTCAVPGPYRADAGILCRFCWGMVKRQASWGGRREH